MKQIIIIMLSIFITLGVIGQTKVKQEGNKLTALSTTRAKSDTTKTEFTYTDTKGKESPVWKTINGKYFVGVVSKNGNYYRKYLTIAQ